MDFVEKNPSKKSNRNFFWPMIKWILPEIYHLLLKKNCADVYKILHECHCFQSKNSFAMLIEMESLTVWAGTFWDFLFSQLELDKSILLLKCNFGDSWIFSPDLLFRSRWNLWVFLFSWAFWFKKVSQEDPTDLLDDAKTLRHSQWALVSYPTRWSFSFILGPLHWSSIFLTSSEQRNIVQLCTKWAPTAPLHV